MVFSADAWMPPLAYQTNSPAPDAGQGAVAWDFLRLIGYGLLLLWALWWWGSRMGKWPSIQKWVRSQGSLRVLETRPLGFRSQLHLVAYGEQRFLIGSSPSGIHLVSEVVDIESPRGRVDADQARGRAEPWGWGSESDRPATQDQPSTIPAPPNP